MTFVAFFMATIFMVFFSIDAVDHWVFPWNQVPITLACLIPLFMVIIQYGPDWFHGKNVRRELYILILMIILSFFIVLFGQERLPNFKGIGIFMLPAVGAFTASTFIFRSSRESNRFFWLYAGLILTAVIFGLWQYLEAAYLTSFPSPDDQIRLMPIKLFSSNPIPAGTVLVCLSAGPIMLLAQNLDIKRKYFLYFVLLAGSLLIALLQGRGAILSLVAIVLFFGIFKNHKFLFLIFILVLMFLLGFVFYEQLPSVFQNKLDRFTKIPIFRLEMISFGYHIFRDFPLTGIGPWTPLERFLWDYETPMFTLLPMEFNSFKWLVGTNTSFHNIFIYILVHMGVLFFIVYICFVFSIFFSLIKE